MAKVLRDLGAPVAASAVAHLDPDLDPHARKRKPGWLPMFGQANAAEAHLRTAGVGAGDLFLFFGWFRQTELVAGKLRYVASAPDLHVLFGWLQVGAHHPHPGWRVLPAWAHDHPHCKPTAYGGKDSVYLATRDLRLPGLRARIAGGGVFKRFSPGLRLTAADARLRSQWVLPRWFRPSGVPRLTYHANPARWTKGTEHVRLRVVGRGQEFVLQRAPAAGVAQWVEALI